LRPFIEGLHCRVGTVGPIALRWVSGVEVQCVATAQPSRRAAPVAVLTSISMGSSMPSGNSATAAAAGLPLVRFEINAERLDPRGRPGGRSLLLGGTAAAAASPDNRAASVGAAALHAASPGSTTGNAPIMVAGRHLTADHDAGGRCW